MTNACPRCSAPLHGPVCGMCGTRVDAPAPAPHPYAPPGMPYGQPPAPYGAPAGPAPSKAMAVTGGVMAIVISSLYLLFAVLGTIGNAAGDDPDKASGVAGGIILTLYAAAGLTFGIYAVKGRWWGAMIGGILQSLMGLLLLLSYFVIEEAQREGGLGAALVEKEIGIVKTVILVWLLITAAIAIFNFMGIPSAKNWERAMARSHLRAADEF